MKKLMAMLMALVLVFSMIACAKDEAAPVVDETVEETTEEVVEETTEEVTEEPIELNVFVLSGPTGIGAANMMAASDAGELEQGYNFTVAAMPDEIVGKIVNGDADIAAIATNLASKVYTKTEGGITVLGVNTLGVLSVLEMEQTVETVSDLAGKTIYTSGQGANPQFILEYVLRANGLDPETDVTIVYKTENAELATVFAEDPEAVIMAPHPVATSIMINSGAVISLDMTKEWEAVSQDSALMMGCIVVRNEVLENNPGAVAAFMADYAASIEAANADPATTGTHCETYGIVAKAALATKAIPQCNIVWVTGEEMKTQLSGYLQVLFEADPASVGGKVPEDSFYYVAE